MHSLNYQERVQSNDHDFRFTGPDNDPEWSSIKRSAWSALVRFLGIHEAINIFNDLDTASFLSEKALALAYVQELTEAMTKRSEEMHRAYLRGEATAEQCYSAREAEHEAMVQAEMITSPYLRHI